MPLQLTYKRKLQPQAPPPYDVAKLLALIASALQKQYEDGNITLQHLSDIHNLATNTTRLQNALKWL